MSITKQQSWIDLLPLIIIGAEEGDDDNSNDTSSDDAEKGKGDAGSDSQGSSKQTHDDADDEAVKGLKSALAAERADADKERKRANALQKEKDATELAKKSDIEQANIKAENAEKVAAKLAEGLLSRDLNDAVKAAATDLGFIDVSDALAGVGRDELTFEQDTDDPTNITIDMKSVEKAVKALATKKPHFLKSGTDDGHETGGKFNNRSKKKDEEQDLKKLYPSL